MSTSPDLVQTLSRWLAGHVDVGQVQEALAHPGVRGELARPDVSRPELQPLVRETIEAIALRE
jgi:hypothetical protein